MRRFFAFSLLTMVVCVTGTSTATFAQTKEELQEQIAQRNAQIKALEAEIAQVQASLDATSKERQTLQSTVATLDLARKKLTANVQLTQTKISSKDAEIRALGNNINKTTGKIGSQRDSVASSMRELNQLDADGGMLVSMLAGINISDALQGGVQLVSVRGALLDHVDELSALKNTLVITKSDTEKKREELAVLKADLVSQQKVLDQNRAEKNALLASTKNQESAYQAQLKQKQAQQKQFESDLLDFQSKLNIIIDPNSIPKTATGVLGWPVTKVRVTQNFGNTDFSTKNPQIYNGNGHSGIDLAASPGTPILAARGGTVKGTGDTDLTCPGASYGRWVLIEHTNGLSTLYAHLSVIRVDKGQSVSLGETIGYSGSTGYATGPHLHFAVFATQGVEIRQLPSKASACKGRIYTMPVGDLKAYLNPLSYL